MELKKGRRRVIRREEHYMRGLYTLSMGESEGEGKCDGIGREWDGE